MLLPIDSEPLETTQLLRDRYQSPAARAFAEPACAVCAELEQPALSTA